MKIVYSLRSSGCIPNSEIYFSIIKKESEECLRRMNRSLFLVLYDDSYYDALFSSELSYSLMIHSGDEESIGTVSFRVQGSDAYLYTFGLLPHLRGLGLGSLILAHLESYIKSQFGISTLSLHVHSSNERALAFYQRTGSRSASYYPNIMWMCIQHQPILW